MPRITDFEIDDENRDKFAAHGLTARRLVKFSMDPMSWYETGKDDGHYIWSSGPTMVGPALLYQSNQPATRLFGDQ
jgi:hypothetical protein